MYKVPIKFLNGTTASATFETLEEAKEGYYLCKDTLARIESIQLIYISDDDIKLIKYDGRVE